MLQGVCTFPVDIPWQRLRSYAAGDYHEVPEKFVTGALGATSRLCPHTLNFGITSVHHLRNFDAFERKHDLFPMDFAVASRSSWLIIGPLGPDFRSSRRAAAEIELVKMMLELREISCAVGLGHFGGMKALS